MGVFEVQVKMNGLGVGGTGVEVLGKFLVVADTQEEAGTKIGTSLVVEAMQVEAGVVSMGVGS